MGLNYDEIEKADVTETELSKMKKFHDFISQGVHYVTACHRSNIDLMIAKRMFKMYNEKQQGQTFSFCTRRPRIRTAFRMLIEGFDDDEIRESGCSDMELVNAKSMLLIAHKGNIMLYSTIAKQIGTTKATVSDLLKVFRENQKNEDNKTQISV
jgi:hypothetical protein